MFAFLPYVPAFSKAPKCKLKTVPTPDHTDYLVTINNRIQALATANPIGQAFSNKTVGYNHSKNKYKPSSWRGYNSIAPEMLRISCCYTYTDRELVALPMLCLLKCFIPNYIVQEHFLKVFLLSADFGNSKTHPLKIYLSKLIKLFNPPTKTFHDNKESSSTSKNCVLFPVC